MPEPNQSTDPNVETPDPTGPTFAAQVAGMTAAFWGSPQRNRLFLLAVAIVAVIGGTAYAQIRLNAWNQPFYDALTRKDVPEFLRQLGVFAVLAGILLALNVSQTWLNQTSKVTLRRGLVTDLLGEWLAPRRAFRLSTGNPMGTNPDQRLQADAQHLCDLSTDLGIGLLQSTLLLASFIGVLWGLSDGMFLPIGGYHFAPPGYMVWCALLYAGFASLLSWWVGRPLIRLDADHYAREAELRFALVRVGEEIEGIAIYGGEANEEARLLTVFDRVIDISTRIVRAATRLTWVTAGYGWFTIVAPILVAAPGYFAGKMTFGELMVVVGAFNQVQNSLRWFVDNFSAIADWQATLVRVAGFRSAVLDMDRLGLEAGRIEVTEGASLRLDHLRVATPSGCVMLSDPKVGVEPGQRLLISGEHRAGKTLLFRAIAGLWPWGSGRITRPKGDALMFLPSRAYVPPGELRAALTYPLPADSYDTTTVHAALTTVGLKRLVPMLDRSDRWDKALTEDEKQCLAFARVMLHRPQWVISDNVLERLDPSSRKRIVALFQGPLSGVGMIHVGHEDHHAGFFDQTLQLVLQPEGPSFTPGLPATAVEPAAAP